MTGVHSGELIRRPHPCLRRYVGDYVGYDFSGLEPGIHLGMPSGALTFIVSIDQPLLQYDEVTGRTSSFDVLLAGLHLAPSLITHSGAMSGIQINFSPFASRALFDVPAGEFAHRTVDLRDVASSVAVELHERVNSAPRWADRFDAIDDVLVRSFSERTTPSVEILNSWKQIANSHGGLPISLVADEVGWSRRHLNARFHAEFGIGPKDAARVIRFDRARRLIRSRSASLATIAAECGYSDQSHLNRDFKLLTGTSPTTWLDTDELARISGDEG